MAPASDSRNAVVEVAAARDVVSVMEARDVVGAAGIPVVVVAVVTEVRDVVGAATETAGLGVMVAEAAMVPGENSTRKSRFATGGHSPGTTMSPVLSLSPPPHRWVLPLRDLRAHFWRALAATGTVRPPSQSACSSASRSA